MKSSHKVAAGVLALFGVVAVTHNISISDAGKSGHATTTSTRSDVPSYDPMMDVAWARLGYGEQVDVCREYNRLTHQRAWEQFSQDGTAVTRRDFVVFFNWKCSSPRVGG